MQRTWQQGSSNCAAPAQDTAMLPSAPVSHTSWRMALSPDPRPCVSCVPHLRGGGAKCFVPTEFAATRLRERTPSNGAAPAAAAAATITPTASPAKQQKKGKKAATGAGPGADSGAGGDAATAAAASSRGGDHQDEQIAALQEALLAKTKQLTEAAKKASEYEKRTKALELEVKSNKRRGGPTRSANEAGPASTASPPKESRGTPAVHQQRLLLACGPSKAASSLLRCQPDHSSSSTQSVCVLLSQ